MASACDPSSNHHPPSELPSDGGVDSPRLPWAQVVRGEPESITAVHHHHQSPPSSSSSLSSLAPSVSEQIPSSDCSSSKAAPASSYSSSPPSPPPMNNSSAAESSNGHDSGIAGKLKKPVWNKLSNGVVEAGSVMGAASWPALSESARASPKLSADSSSSKPVADGSISTSQGPVKTHSPKKQVNANANPNSAQNHPRQRLMKRGGGGGAGGGPAHGNFAPHSQPPPPPPLPPPPQYIYPMIPTYGNLMPVYPDPTPRDAPFRRPVAGQGFMPQQQHPINDHRNSSRRGNFVPHPQGDGPYHNNYGGRRDHDRRNFGNARDAHMQPQRGHPPHPPRGVLRPPPPNAAFIAQPHARPFANPMPFADYVYVPIPIEPIRGTTYTAHPSVPPMFVPSAERPLTVSLVDQIDYYFSDANLVRDEYLRSNMDDQGWVPISLIASFPRVKRHNLNNEEILSSLRASSVVEVQDYKVRRRNDWVKWAPTSGRPLGSISRGNSSPNLLASSLQKIAIEEVAPSQNSTSGKADHNPEDAPDQHSTEPTAQPQLANGEVATQNTH